MSNPVNPGGLTGTPGLPYKRSCLMFYKAVALFVLSLCFTGHVALAGEGLRVEANVDMNAKLTEIIRLADRFESPGDRIVEISSHFINAPYAAGTLHGGPLEAERLVVELSRFDCFTFLDVVEALRRSPAAKTFSAQLQAVRYRNGQVDYAARRHFFSDWVADRPTLISDVTAEIGQNRALVVVKQLNRKDDGSLWLPELAVKTRNIIYIPTRAIDVKVLSALNPGDYVGIFSEHAGLDVNHTGLIVKTSDGVLLRHASSRPGVERVVDEELMQYIQDKSGLLVYRVKP